MRGDGAMSSVERFYSLLYTLCEMVGYNSKEAEDVNAFMEMVLEGIGCPQPPPNWDNVSVHYKNAQMEHSAFLFSLWRARNRKYLLPFRNMCLMDEDMKWLRSLARGCGALKYRNQPLPSAVKAFFAALLLVHKVLCAVGAPPKGDGEEVKVRVARHLHAIVTNHAIFFFDGCEEDG